MAGIDIMGGLNKAFLATVGAVAITAEKSQQAVEELVKKGELTVQQGKALNQELSRKAKEAASETTDGALRTFLEALSDEDRAAYAEKVAQLTADIRRIRGRPPGRRARRRRRRRGPRGRRGVARGRGT